MLKRYFPLLLLAGLAMLGLALALGGTPAAPPYDPILDAERLHSLEIRRLDDQATTSTRQAGAALWQLLPPLLLAGLAAVFLATFTLDRKAKRRRLEPDANGFYPLLDPTVIARELAPELGRHIALTLAGGSMQALVERYKAAPVYAGRALPAEALPQLPAPLEAAGLPTAPAYADILAGGWRPSSRQMLLGYGHEGPIYGGIETLLSTAIAGRPGQGKTTALRFIYAQTIMAGGQVVILDPHGSIGDAVGDAGALWTASTAAELDDAGGWLQDELERRGGAYRAGERTFSPLLVLCDEWPVISLQSKGAVTAASRIILEARKWGAYALISGQGLPADRFNGSLVRDALSSRFVFKTSASQARMAGLDKEAARLVDGLDVGRCVLDGPVEPQIVAIPNTTALDLASLANRTGATSPAERATETLSGGERPFSQVSAYERPESISDDPQPTLEIASIVARLKAAGMGKGAIIETLWGARPGASRTYQQASRLYDQVAGG